MPYAPPLSLRVLLHRPNAPTGASHPALRDAADASAPETPSTYAPSDAENVLADDASPLAFSSSRRCFLIVVSCSEERYCLG